MRLIQKELADLLNVSDSMIRKVRKQGRVVRGADNNYDLDDLTNRSYIREHFHREYTELREEVDEAASELELEKLRAEIEWKNRQNRKLDREHEIAIGRLIPMEAYVQTMGFVDYMIRNDLLSIGEAIARGDAKLRDRIESELKKRLEKGLKRVHAQRREFVEAEVEKALREAKGDEPTNP